MWIAEKFIVVPAPRGAHLPHCGGSLRTLRDATPVGTAEDGRVVADGGQTHGVLSRLPVRRSPAKESRTMTTTAGVTQEAARDQEEIAAVPARMVAAWAAHDADAFADLFAEDGTLILPGVYRRGRADIRSFMAAGFAGRYQGTTVTGQPIDLKPLGPGAVALLTVGGVIAPGQTELSSPEAIRASWILVKRDGRWVLAVYHNCPRDPA
jgi:uncharacterized protein (TIGR02246 family)